jgi:hypothetical protein
MEPMRGFRPAALLWSQNRHGPAFVSARRAARSSSGQINRESPVPQIAFGKRFPAAAISPGHHGKKIIQEIDG